MFCTTGQRDLILRVAAAVVNNGRLCRVGALRWDAPNSGVMLDYDVTTEVRVSYKPMTDRYKHIARPLGDPKRIKTTTYGQVERLTGDGWCAVIHADMVVANVSGDLKKMVRDLTHLRLAGDVV